jgi:hypothetical protein
MVKEAARKGRELYVASPQNTGLIPLVHRIERHLSPFDPPPLAPEPEGEPQPVAEVAT